MGMGEPLHNFDNLTRALALLEHPWGAGFSPRRITVSTAGLVPGIEKLAAQASESSAPNLAISLNATTDEVRDRIMPINKRWPIAALLEAARRFPLVARPPGHLRVRACSAASTTATPTPTACRASCAASRPR